MIFGRSEESSASGPYYFSRSVDDVMIEIRESRRSSRGVIRESTATIREGFHNAGPSGSMRGAGGSMRGAPVDDDSDDDRRSKSMRGASQKGSMTRGASQSFRSLRGTSSEKGNKKSVRGQSRGSDEMDEVFDAHRRLMMMNALKRDQSKVYHLVDDKGVGESGCLFVVSFFFSQ